MGRKKELYYYNGKLKGKYLEDADCRILDKIIELSENNGCIADLKHSIFDLSENDIEYIKEGGDPALVDKEVGTLSDQQTVGSAFLFYSKRCVLGDSVGLGKTVEVCSLMNVLKTFYEKQGVQFRFLYLTEKNLLAEARNKIIRFTGEYIDMLRGEKKYVEDFIERSRDGVHSSVVGSHSLINSQLFQEYIRMMREEYGVNPFDALVVDESSVLGNTSTKTYSNAKDLAEDIDWVVVLNATPFEKNLRTFYAQINFVDDSLLPVKTVFQDLYEERDYTGPYPKFNGKYKNQDIFKKQVAYRYLKRTRKDLGARFEDCTCDVKVCGLSVYQRNLLKISSMPQMVIDCPSYLDRELDMNAETTPKVGVLYDLFDNELNGARSVLIYTQYKESQEGIKAALEERGISCEVMNGSTPFKEREIIARRFRMGDFRALITNVQKGLDFDNCNYCVFYSYNTNPNNMVQFEGRMTRQVDIIGKHVYMIVSKGRELKNLKTLVSDRATASDMFAGSDFSCVLSLLLDDEKIKSLGK